MSVPATKAELLAAIDKTFAQLERDLDRVPLASVREPVLDGHVKNTCMSPADLVAYLIGWNQQVLTWHRRRAAGLPDEFPAPGIKWNELGSLAQRYYAAHADDSWEQLRTQLRDAKSAIIELIDGYSDADLYGRPWYGKWTMGRMISFNTSSPYANARGRIRAWLRTL
ncbi:ClbS/DfsB family four-helix bundle protein [Pseudoclavibacter sp. CFCC 13611]|uniref:ClbS/DfsB family four-helix bundle protein n=1 Tax=Pseudoclavibacter sp. CFCC 13611 TaxID=2615178 RepID=UPI0013010DDB|nr:ClbS/DfsB family four-helix bundle protein [Pseudoclavibacter sp. CFCC 13611]KAB1663578.1 ClbS/DfsB family four-helix bundle protein [Pseudoclavibacter sp. CFCC 13611]